MFLTDYAKLTGKYLHWSVFWTKLQPSNLPFATLIKEETPAQVLSCEFWEIFKNTFFIKHLCVTPSVTLTLLKYDFQFIVHFSPTVATYQIIYQTQWIWYCWRAPAKWSITVHLCSKSNKWIWLNWQWVFTTFYLKELQSGLLVLKSLNTSSLRLHNFCFKAESISRDLNARLGKL